MYFIQTFLSTNVIMKGGGSFTSFCPICGLHFYISYDELLKTVEEYDDGVFYRNKKKNKMCWTKNRDKIVSNINKLIKSKKSTFSHYKGITLLLQNSKVKHNVKFDDNNVFVGYDEVYLDTPLQSFDNEGTKGLPMHTECWNLAKSKFKHELKLDDFLYNKNVKVSNDRETYLFDSIDYGVAKKYQGQDWSDNNYGLDPDSFLLNNKDWYILYRPSNKSDEASKNSKRLEKILKKIINGIKKPKQENIQKNKDRPSPSQSATMFKKGTKKKGNDGNMYIVETDKNGTKKWKKYIKENNDRPSPAKSATAFKEGTKKRGNDGNMYIIVVNKNGVKRWSKINKVV